MKPRAVSGLSLGSVCATLLLVSQTVYLQTEIQKQHSPHYSSEPDLHFCNRNCGIVQTSPKVSGVLKTKLSSHGDLKLDLKFLTYVLKGVRDEAAFSCLVSLKEGGCNDRAEFCSVKDL